VQEANSKAFLKKERKYKGQIKKNYRNYFLGHFETPQEAHEAYAAAASERFGELARS
jgi:hypothetical protein